ncbi:MAG TPA: hypothetical protein VF116_00990 [Ktedonobacterales bacterium]
MYATLLRRLADFEPVDAPVLSIYLDMRPHAVGGRPALRDDVLRLGDRLRQIEKTFGPRGPDLDSFRADAARIETYLRDHYPAAAHGVAIFACSATNLFEVIEAGVSFEFQVSINNAPDLFQLARFVDDEETAVVAIVDTNTVRLFVVRGGFVDEHEGLDEGGPHFHKTRLGGLNVARYQRHVEKHRTDFAREAAAEIALLVEREGASRVILAGNQVALPLLRNALSPRVLELEHGGARGLNLEVTRDVVVDEIAPILARAEAESERAIADQLVDAVRADALGVAGLEDTLQALEHAQVDVLVLVGTAPLDADTRANLVRLAVITGADVEVIEAHDVLERLGGIGALLRFRHEAPAAVELSAEDAQPSHDN